MERCSSSSTASQRRTSRGSDSSSASRSRLDSTRRVSGNARPRLTASSVGHRALFAAPRASTSPAREPLYLTERHGSAYRLTVATLESETPNPVAVAAAVKAQTPAGIVLTNAVVRGGTYQALRATHPDYADVRATFLSYSTRATTRPDSSRRTSRRTTC